MLAVGFVINAAVVIRSVTWDAGKQAHASHHLTSEEASGVWGSDLPSDRLWVEVEGRSWRCRTLSFTMIGAAHEESGETVELRVRVISEAGWPLRSFSGTQHTVAHTTQFKEVTSTTGMLVLPDRVFGIPTPGLWTSRGHLIPAEPLWSGLLLNTFFYGGVAGVVWVVGGRIRRRFRLDSRRCAACRYDLRESLRSDPVLCPECGSAWRIAHLRRPCQMLRSWMLAFMVPLLLLALIWLFSDKCAPALELCRIRIRDPFASLGASGTTSLGLVALCLLGSASWMAWRSYDDRSPVGRVALSTVAALALTCAALLPYFVIVYGMLK